MNRRESPAPDERRNTFILRLAEALHTAGSPAHDLEAAVNGCATRLGIEAHVYATPTAIFASFGRPEDHRTSLLRTEPVDVDLARLSRVDDLRLRVVRGEVAPEDGIARLEEISAAPRARGSAGLAAASALASGASARFLGGGAREIAAAAAIGLSIAILSLAIARWRPRTRLFESAGGAVAALLAAVAASLVPATSQAVAVLAGVIVLLPGFSLTLAMNELATRNLAAGTARLTGAGMSFLSIAFGVAAGRALGLAALQAPAAAGAVEGLPEWTIAIALLVAPLALGALFQAHAKDWPVILAVGVAGYAAARLAGGEAGSAIGAFAGAFTVGCASHLVARIRERPAAVTTVPGLVLLVPGSIGFRSLDALMADDALRGIDAAFEMMFVAFALVAGLLLANEVLPPRRRGRD